MSPSNPITSIILALLVAAAQLTAGSPISSPTQLDKQTRSSHNTHDRSGGTPDLSCLTLPTIPGAATPLPTPPAGYKLKHIALGNALPPLALAMYGALASVEGESWWDAVIAQMPWNPTTSSSTTNANTLPSTAFGEHFFSFAGTPTWDLLPPLTMYPDEAASIVFQGKKEASLAAPLDACPGLDGEGAVPWLYLTKASTTDDGIAAVYRVVTAGGMQPDTCEGIEEQEIEVKYAAEYWFYGP
ncbi:putative malate dehydrogenase protein [Lasiodiplodia theobromae]|nr:putative malate dehydrogenase protein [Lasiodiplodia theobromae]